MAWLVVGCAAAASPAAELPQSDGCHVALRALSDAEDALTGAGSAASAASGSSAGSAQAMQPADRQRLLATRLFPLRQRVADACLGGMTTSPSPSQHTAVVQAPWRPSDPARHIQMPMPKPVAAQPPLGVVLPRPSAPLTVSHCTGATCLASDGSTLTRVGTMLVGPRGTCTMQGAFLQCP